MSAWASFPSAIAQPIAAAASDIAAGRHDQEFPVARLADWFRHAD